MFTAEIYVGVTDQKVSDAFFIRREVFVKEQNVPEELEMDGLDANAHHVVVRDFGLPAACGRLVFVDDDYLIGRIAVLKDKRKQGFGGLVVRMLVRQAFDHGADRVLVHAQLSAAEFYNKLGFVKQGDIFLDAGIEHILMEKSTDFFCEC